jgi:steroid delta-isomerase-like uncharacterized protein
VEAIMKRILHVGFLLVLLATSLVAQNKPHIAAHRAGLAESWITAWNSHDPDKLTAIFTADVMYEDVPFSAVNHGSAELRKFAASEFEGVPDLRVELANSSIQGEHGSIEWTFSGTDAGIFKTGKKFSVRGVSIVTVKNGKISRNIDYYDVATLMKQVGLSPSQDSAPKN